MKRYPYRVTITRERDGERSTYPFATRAEAERFRARARTLPGHEVPQSYRERRNGKGQA